MSTLRHEKSYKIWLIGKQFKNKHFHIIFPYIQCQWFHRNFSAMTSRAETMIFHVPNSAARHVPHTIERFHLASPLKDSPVIRRKNGRLATAHRQLEKDDRPSKRSGPATADDNNKTTWQGPVPPLAPVAWPTSSYWPKCMVGGKVKRALSRTRHGILRVHAISGCMQCVCMVMCVGIAGRRWIFRWDGWFFRGIACDPLAFCSGACSVSLCF